MTRRLIAAAAALVAVVAACARQQATRDEIPATPAPPPSFVNRVWQVDSSTSVARGTLYVFLSEGTLIVASANATAMVGAWTLRNDSLTMVEEGIAYPTDILHLDAQRFRIRSHNPGEPVDISLVPAPSELSTSVWGTAWKLEDLGGTRLADSVEVTLEFMDEGKAGGRGPCNRYFATATVHNDSIDFTGIGSTKMACLEEARMDQETRYFKALEDADRYAIEGTTLTIHAAGMDQPLRFSRRPR